MIRFYKADDLSAVKKIALDNAKDTLLNIEAIINHNEGRVYVYELGSEILGFGFYQPFGLGKRIDCAVVVDISARRQGYGTQLWQVISSDAKRSYEPTSFECKIACDDLPAINFCGKCGFLPWFTTHTMVYNDELLPTPQTVFEPYEDKYYEKYYELIGDAFYDLRKSLGVQPYKIVPNGDRDEMFEGETFLAVNTDDVPIAAVTIEFSNQIDNLAVSPKAQNLGFGRQLAIFATNRCLMSELGYAQLDVVAQNTKALELYKSLGYKIHRTIAVLKFNV